MFHGRSDGGEPEWPPSPLRLFQALVAAAAARWRGSEFADRAQSALKWFEARNPAIVAHAIRSERTAYRTYVPHNAGDLMTAAWKRGDIDASMATHRIEKDIRATRLIVPEGEFGTIRYLYPLPNDDPAFDAIKTVLADTARSVSHLGWGIDMVVADASIISGDEASKLAGERWFPAQRGNPRLRVPRAGTLDGLIRKHTAFLNRIGPNGFQPVPPLSEFDVVSYRTSSAPIPRPYAVFELRNDDGSRFGYPQNKLIHLAGMVRHLAIRSMTDSPPGGVPDDWVRTYVAGHAVPGRADHRQFSYLPLPSIGHFHTDPSVRRVMIAAAVGDERLLNRLATRMAGQQLEPTPETKLRDPPILVRCRGDKVTDFYTSEAKTWASVTPVILPGHDDRKPDKTRRLIEKALLQSGTDQACEFEWSSISHFPKSLTAHKYDRNKRRIGYIRPDHLLNQTAVHLRLEFEYPVAGPLAIGSGRHCGLGLFARVD
jgi:CRISPR-associated protein Csb2